MRELPARFLDKIEFEPNSGCWLWAAAMFKNGYGKYRSDDGRTTYAHRLSWQFEHGEIPDDLELDHRCRVRLCVNPGHLEAVTHQVNVLRGILFRGRKTHCPNGHEYKPETAYRHAKNGSWICLICRKDRYRERHPKRGPATHCIRGHEFNEANTYTYKNGARGCRICIRLRARGQLTKIRKWSRRDGTV
jgi:hypothetical protein